jgi:hypothetical protein
VGIEADTSAERSLKQVAVGRCGGAPLDGAKECREDLCIIGTVTREIAPGIVVKETSVELRVPNDAQFVALRIVVDAGKRCDRRRTGFDLFAQPAPPPNLDEIARLRWRLGMSRSCVVQRDQFSAPLQGIPQVEQPAQSASKGNQDRVVGRGASHSKDAYRPSTSPTEFRCQPWATQAILQTAEDLAAEGDELPPNPLCVRFQRLSITHYRMN